MSRAKRMTIDRWVTNGAAQHPNRIAIEFEGASLSYAEFADLIELRAHALAAHGIDRGDRVAWFGLNNPEVFVLLFACARIGAILVPLNWRLSRAELQAITKDCAPKLMFHDAHFEAQANELGCKTLPSGELTGHASFELAVPSDPLLIVYTSGSTGTPKGVVLDQNALVTNAKMSVAAHALCADDRVLNVLPLFHVGGLNILPTPAFSIGATVVLHEKFDPDAMAAELPNVTHAITVPTVLQAVMGSNNWSQDSGRLRALSIGSTDVPKDLIEAVHKRGIPLLQIYGATETSPFAIYQTVDDAMQTAGSIGKTGSECRVRLVMNDADVETGTPGEIWVKGDNVLKEYWKNADLTTEAKNDGWFKTGDVAYCDEDGYFWFADRVKHMIISGGENIYPAEIERILRTLVGVKEVAVVGRPDPKWGEVPVAVVVGSASKSEVLSALDGKLARYKHAKDVVYVDALPRNAMGKVVVADVKKQIFGT